jgi:hypothetical protein
MLCVDTIYSDTRCRSCGKDDLHRRRIAGQHGRRKYIMDEIWKWRGEGAEATPPLGLEVPEETRRIPELTELVCPFTK